MPFSPDDERFLREALAFARIAFSEREVPANFVVWPVTFTLSEETLGKLQKVRTDVEKLLNAFINILFTSIVGILFVMVYAFSVHWIIAPVYFLTIPLLGTLSSVLSRAWSGRISVVGG